VSDAGVPTGFATVTHNILGWLGSKWERVVLGVNSTGDPHRLPFPIYPARVGGDFWGFARFPKLVAKYAPDVCVIQSDAWIVTGFLQIAQSMAKESQPVPPLVGYMPIDGRGMKRETARELSALARAIFYTQFGVEQALEAGLSCPTGAIGLGVRREVFHPMPRSEARAKFFPELPEGAFLFGCVNRNQPRKRLDLLVAWFAEFLKTDDAADDSFLYLHCLREDVGWDLEELAHYYGIADRIILCRAKTPEELTDETQMRLVYNALDVQLSTSLGEGWGLPTLEGMACGIPQIVPKWAALAEWPAGAVRYVDVEPGAANFGHKAFGIGATPLKADFLRAMHELRVDGEERARLGRAALERSLERRFDWSFAAACFDEDLNGILARGRERAA
jgi:glycosyltransferase involved in cell wall biosynthesis